jgi:hypothetical protein
MSPLASVKVFRMKYVVSKSYFVGLMKRVASTYMDTLKASCTEFGFFGACFRP